AKDLRPTLYDDKVIGLGYTSMFLTHSDEALEIEKIKRSRENKIEFAYDYGNLNANLDIFSSVRRPNHSSVVWKKKESSNTSNVDLSAVNVLKLNKNVKRYSRKDLLACNNSHLGETSSASMCNDTMNVSCNLRMCDLLDDNNFFIFDDVNVRISPGSKMPFRKKPRDSMHIVQIYLWILDSGCSKHMTSNQDKGSEVIISFIKKTQVNLQLQVQCVRIDNGTEFKNKTLAKFFDEVSITQQFSAATMPQQNGVMERRNRTLVEAARTMLIFANLPSFL
nr:putative ribonuclease H-like domain-containing protein [Tanacetum cinerariifolium]